MTLDESRKLVELISQIWKYYEYADDMTEIREWWFFLQDRTYRESQAALYEFERTQDEGFAPTPGQLLRIMDKHKEKKINARAYEIVGIEQKFGACPMPDRVRARYEELRKEWGM